MPAGVLGEASRLRDTLQMSGPVFWLVLIGMTGCTLWTLAGWRRAGRRVPAPRAAALLTLGFALTWVLVDKRLEGPTLIILSDRHGVTVSDLASLVAALVAGRRLLPGRSWSGAGPSPSRSRPVDVPALITISRDDSRD